MKEVSVTLPLSHYNSFYQNKYIFKKKTIKSVQCANHTKTILSKKDGLGKRTKFQQPNNNDNNNGNDNDEYTVVNGGG